MRANNYSETTINENYTEKNAGQKAKCETTQFETAASRVDDVVVRGSKQKTGSNQPQQHSVPFFGSPFCKQNDQTGQ